MIQERRGLGQREEPQRWGWSMSGPWGLSVLPGGERMGALTVLLLHHHGVADGQQAPKLPHHLVLIVPNGTQEPLVSVKQLPIGKFVPEVRVLLRGAVRGRQVLGASQPTPASHCPALKGGQGSPDMGSPPCPHPGLGRDPASASGPPDPWGSHSLHSPLTGFLGPLNTAGQAGPRALDLTPQATKDPPPQLCFLHQGS